LKRYAVDTNVFLNIFRREDPFLKASLRVFMAANKKKIHLIVSEVVLTELLVGVCLSPQPRISRRKLDRFLTMTQIQMIPNTTQVLEEAARGFSEYLSKRGAMFQCPKCGEFVKLTCPSCGVTISPRERVLPDFLVGAHAAIHANGLVTRERSIYEMYFPSLELLTPEEILSQVSLPRQM